MEMPPPLPCLAMVHGVGAQDQPPTATTLISVADARPLAGAGVLALEEELKNKYLCPTPQGWMLVHDPDAATTYLLDAKRRQKIQLPRLAVEQRLIPYCSCLLSGEPTAAGCPVVLLVEPIDATIWYCRVGDSEWTRHEYDIGTVGDEYFVEKRVIAPIAAFGGRFYFNPVPAETRVLELLLRPGAAALAPVFGSVAREPESTEDDGFVGTAEVFMVGTGDELYQVMLAQNGGRYDEVRVMRMDFADRRWRLVDELGGRAFFVAPMYFGASCVPVAGDGGIRQDCVYSLVGAAKNSFRVFNLKDGTSQVCSSHELETVGKSRPCWVLPTTHPRA
ncbi:hypothetical protein ACQ4PT_025493 [Festuca glaucescens]